MGGRIFGGANRNFTVFLRVVPYFEEPAGLIDFISNVYKRCKFQRKCVKLSACDSKPVVIVRITTKPVFYVQISARISSSMSSHYRTHFARYSFDT